MLILFSYLWLGLQSHFFPLHFPTKIMYIMSIAHMDAPVIWWMVKGEAFDYTVVSFLLDPVF
jgi:hypothetical protein